LPPRQAGTALRATTGVRMRRLLFGGLPTEESAQLGSTSQLSHAGKADQTARWPWLSRRNWLKLGLSGIAGVLGAPRSSLGGTEPVQSLSAREARELAQQLIPFDKLQEPTQERLWNVVSRTSIHRRMPEQRVACDPDLYLFFVRNPEVVVSMWQLMGITNMTIKRVQDYTYDATDGLGTQARIELIYGTPDKHVFLADGAYEGSLIKRKTPGRCVLVLRTSYVRDRDQHAHLENQLDAFIQLDSMGTEIVAKTLHPVFGKTADHNFTETLTFVSRLSQAIEKNSSGVERLAARLKGVDPPVKQKFIEVATAANHRAVLRQPERTEG